MDEPPKYYGIKKQVVECYFCGKIKKIYEIENGEYTEYY